MTANAHPTHGVQHPVGQAELNRLADDVEHTRARWHAARQARDDALHAFDEATRAEARAALDHAAAITRHDAAKVWRS